MGPIKKGSVFYKKDFIDINILRNTLIVPIGINGRPVNTVSI